LVARDLGGWGETEFPLLKGGKPFQDEWTAASTRVVYVGERSRSGLKEEKARGEKEGGTGVWEKGSAALMKKGGRRRRGGSMMNESKR